MSFFKVFLCAILCESHSMLLSDCTTNNRNLVSTIVTQYEYFFHLNFIDYNLQEEMDKFMK